MIATIASAALFATVHFVYTAIGFRRKALRRRTEPSTWTALRAAVRGGRVPRHALVTVPVMMAPGHVAYGMWRLAHPTPNMVVSAVTWTVMVALGTCCITVLQWAAAATGWPFPLLLALACTAVTLIQLAGTTRRIGWRRASRLLPLGLVSNFVAPMAVWASIAVIGALA